MLDQLILKIKQLPKLLLGFIVILIVLLVLYFNDPPKTICDIQMQSVNASLVEGFYNNSKEGDFGKSAKAAKIFCLSSNSPGGCRDMLSRMDYLEKQIRTIPSECGYHASTKGIRSNLQISLKLLAEIAWGDKPPLDKYNKISWFDTRDLGLYCRLKLQHQRLYGKEAWNQFAFSVIATLPGANTLEKKELMDRTLYSYPCNGLY
jgi:hypothetical protein